MEINESLVCPKCKGKNFTIIREATYVYSYKFNSKDVTEVNDKTKALPFLFSDRDKIKSNEFIACDSCSAKYPISLADCDNQIDFTILQKAIRSDHIENPEFLG